MKEYRRYPKKQTARASTFGVWVAAATSLLVCSTAVNAAGNGCVASYGPQNDYREGSCSYVAGGEGQYAAAVVGGTFRIYVGSALVVSRRAGAKDSGVFPAAAGQTVTVEVECDHVIYDVYCAPWGEAGAVAAGDR